ncbi:MAG: 2-oxoacid:acceptor oxidoreductase subunit alpha [Clostridiaceae bacterium]|nr:2-oxoacid:acceptor oxidoreductase subunit alpha [Clostridiaceae bacterium]
MKNKLSFVIGGIQGEGIVSAGESIIKILSRLGYYAYSARKFSSRIKGGNTAIIITVGTERVIAVEDKLDIIVALDQETISIYRDKLEEGGLILHDEGIEMDVVEGNGLKIKPLPLTKIAKESGASITKTTAIITFLSRILDIPKEMIIKYFEERFSHKSDKLLQSNKTAWETAFEYDIELDDKYKKQLSVPKETKGRPVMIGNEAVALGALMAGCRLMPAYPITPASEVMEYMGKVLPQYGGIMLQVEDEIAAVTMAIGGGYAGVRSMTATSGPGISLMTEAIGMASITEVPVVIVDTQRVGPSTGMPTKHEQSDLFTLYYGGHGDYPTIILTPSTVEECFEDAIEAFNLAEKYQCPVILVLDLDLGLSIQTIDSLDYCKIKIERGELLTNDELRNIDSKEFKRFIDNETGISPRSIPGGVNGFHHVTAVEHNEKGLPTEDTTVRKRMIEKRFRKIEPLQQQEHIKVIENGSDTLFLALGSTFGVISEAVNLVESPKVDIAAIRMLRPLPIKQLANLLKKYKDIVVFENNYRKQLYAIITEALGYHDKIHSVTKYDGTSFSIGEITKKMGEI